MSKEASKKHSIIGKRIADRFCVTGVIGQGGMGAVYRAIPFDDPSHSVAIKVIQRSGKLGYEDLMRFQKEAALMSRLHHPNIVVFHELGLFDPEQEGDESGYYIVMEIADGTNLKVSLEKDGRKDLAFFFQVGIQVARALDYTHGKNIVHRDIKPHNIVVGQNWRDQRGIVVKVLDFGVAGLAEAINYAGGKDGASPKAFQEAAGTPLYMAPEQTVLMDAPIDHRVDLYSLGCVLYEILTGKPPFTASTREKLEKQHVFADPEPLTTLRPDLPPLVERIVHKLLAKHPADRYQTAFALLADLTRAKTMFDKAGKPSAINFPLGLKDRFQAVSARLTLVGRDVELRQLVEGYDAVSQAKGRSRLTLIRGQAGLGKSRLKAEFQAYLARRRVKFISGSFSQHENALPFNALANAFNEYLYRVLKSHPHEGEELRKRLRTTLGPVAHMIADIVPGLKPFLHDIPEEKDDDDTLEVIENPEVFSKFAKAFSDFTRCLGTDNQPVVFLFDDLHWADAKSLDLIDQFFTNANTLQFYLVVTERTGLMVQNERFTQFVEKFKKLRRRFLAIDLEPLKESAVREIVNNMLSARESISTALLDYLNEDSHGNPMHLVELTRTLVSSDYIFPKSQDGDWDCDIDSLKRTKIRLGTIDLILSRIQDFQQFDREVLSIAATIGLTFQFEMLLLGGRTQSVPVMKAMQRAMDEGLVIRVSDDPDLKHLGKTFMFAHKKARESIYDGIDADRRRELHQTIGDKLEHAIPNPSDKILFALAHHYHSAMDGAQEVDTKLAKASLKYNLAAGYTARSSAAWHVSEEYFNRALVIMSRWKEKVATPIERARVQETLADLAAVQQKLPKAQATYLHLLGQGLPIKTYAHIACKAINLQTILGYRTDTQKLILKTLRHIRQPLPALGFANRLLSIFSILVDMYPGKRKRKRLHKVLKMAFALRKHDVEKLDEKFPTIKLYEAGVILQLRENWKKALMYHHFALEQALRGRGSPVTLIRTVADRAALLGYIGANKVAYQFFDLATDVAKSCKLHSVYGYVCLMRLLTVDYIRGRHVEIAANTKAALKYMQPEQDRLAYVQAITFDIFRKLQDCDFKSLRRLALLVPTLIPTRNWMTPRYVAMLLFAELLQGGRDAMVRSGEKFEKQRKKRGARADDLFMAIIRTLISFARGDSARTKENYVSAMNDFISGRANEFFFPFEEDFIGLFGLTFPILFEQENGRHLMRVEEMEELIGRMRQKIEKLKGQERAVPSLLLARAHELGGNEKKVRAGYDKALNAAKMAGNNLTQVMTLLWFGMYLMQHGQGHGRDYIRNALAIAQKFEMKAIIEFVRKALEKRGIRLKELEMLVSTTTTNLVSKHETAMPSRLFIEHLHFLCDASDSDASLEEDMVESIQILSKYFKSSRITVVISATADQNNETIYPGNPDTIDEQISSYVEPYVNIRSTLYLPSNDAPWLSGEFAGTALDANGMTATHQNGDMPTMAGQEGTLTAGGQATVEADLDATEVGVGGGTATAASDHTKTNAGNVPMPGANLRMNAIVPLRSDFGTTGVMFIENIEQMGSKDAASSRHELDQFGSQLAMLIERKCRTEIVSEKMTVEMPTFIENAEDQAHPGEIEPAKAIYQPASITLERLPWLKLWNTGRLRSGRETSWYLGLALGPNQYLLGFCSLTGDSEVREVLSSMIWHHLHTIRALAISSGRGIVEINELREELTGLLAATPQAAHLDSISLAASIFNADTMEVVSGHFGSSRPLVVGVENKVIPYNEVVMNFSNSRDLRYWEVVAVADCDHVYLLSYDTSQLGNVSKEGLTGQQYRTIVNSVTEEEAHTALHGLVDGVGLPRYYVAGIINPWLYETEKAEEEDQAS